MIQATSVLDVFILVIGQEHCVYQKVIRKSGGGCFEIVVKIDSGLYVLYVISCHG